MKENQSIQARIEEISTAIDRAIHDGVAESIEIAYINNIGEIELHNTTDNYFDVASLTKVVTGLLFVIMDENGIVSLEDNVSKYIDGFDENVKIFNLLRHDSGLRDYDFNLEKIEASDYTIHEKEIIYSDLNYIALFKICDKFGGYENLILRFIQAPIGLHDQIVFPKLQPISKAVRTELRDERIIKQGIVHDNKCYQMGGISGHAGCFATTEGFAKLFLNIEKIMSIKNLINKLEQYKLNDRTIIFEIDDSRNQMGSYKNKGYFHTGFTGTSILLDESLKKFIIVFTNRIYPTRDNVKIFDFRKEISEIYYRNNSEKK